jgi:Fe-S cluster assembly iron-binding protein IscA
MALDEPSENDEVFHEDGFDVIMEKTLVSRFGGVRIDFQSNRWFGSRFFITPMYQTGTSCC